MNLNSRNYIRSGQFYQEKKNNVRKPKLFSAFLIIYVNIAYQFPAVVSFLMSAAW